MVIGWAIAPLLIFRRFCCWIIGRKTCQVQNPACRFDHHNSQLSEVVRL